MLKMFENIANNTINAISFIKPFDKIIHINRGDDADTVRATENIERRPSFMLKSRKTNIVNPVFFPYFVYSFLAAGAIRVIKRNTSGTKI